MVETNATPNFWAVNRSCSRGWLFAEGVEEQGTSAIYPITLGGPEKSLGYFWKIHSVLSILYPLIVFTNSQEHHGQSLLSFTRCLKLRDIPSGYYYGDYKPKEAKTMLVPYATTTLDPPKYSEIDEIKYVYWSNTAQSSAFLFRILLARILVRYLHIHGTHDSVWRTSCP